MALWVQMNFFGTMKALRQVILVALFVCLAPLAWAQTATATLNVSATVIDSARIVSVGDITFGNYDPTSTTATTANGSVTVTATKNLAYKIYIGADRTLTDGSNNLTYGLFSDAGLTNAWGSTEAAGDPTPAPVSPTPPIRSTARSPRARTCQPASTPTR